MIPSSQARGGRTRAAADSAPLPGGAEVRPATSASPVAGVAGTRGPARLVQPRAAAGARPASTGRADAGGGRDAEGSPGRHRARTWTIEMPAGMKLLSLNDRSHWRVRYSRGEVIRKAAWALARASHIPPLQRIAVAGEYQPPDRRKRDEDNLTLSVKSVIDGIKAAGVVLDDSSEYVRYDGCRIGERYPKGRLVITITEVLP